MRWRTKQEPLVPPRAVCSWHDLDELSSTLHFVQAYLDDLPAPGSITARKPGLITSNIDSNPLKRKAPGATSHDHAASNTGLLTPLPSHVSRSPSVSSLDLASEGDDQQNWKTVTVYNGIIQKKEGWISPKKVNEPSSSGTIGFY